MTLGWDTVPSPYMELSRADWSALRADAPLPLTAEELDALRGLRDPIDITEVQEVYLPLSRLLHLYFMAEGRLRATLADFLGATAERTPFVIGVAGSVAVGKSTVSRLLRTLLARWPEHPHVELVTTDSFLYPNQVLAERGLMDRKGFPESYDRRALLEFVTAMKAGVPETTVPVYSHLHYDILPGAEQTVRLPDILILEGLNVLQPPPSGSPAVSDFFDFSIYLDARVEHIREWFVERLFALRRTVFADERSYFHRYSEVDQDETAAFAHRVWREINEVNLVSNILPTRARATLVLHKDRDHSVQRISLRRI
ncbi:type I pantothenate kinase [Thermomonospora cellulosilytica]|uniref:Pantothenate kinase n=1 Tax=Thermomonospora cellulosilytica TaxID=1411118 RepID=A0A7W3MST8_9ACTN|nr:type I pantothenate kinase [Thermomonospora cellulosilytica]MBA9001255.1 type I pantothenate kinase [Thermomonospora cellulosilytica]